MPKSIDGMDRFIKGSISESAIEALGGEDEIGIRFEHLAYGQTFNYSKLSDAHIYDDPEEILNQGEIDMGANGGGGTQIEQDVVFWREGGNLHFATTFDRSGQMCMVITTKDGQELVIDHEMHCQEDVGGLIDTIDEVVSNEWRHETSDTEPEPTGTRELQKRNLTTKAMLPLWEEAKGWFSKGKAVVVGGLKVWVSERKGFVEGAWSGLVDDAKSVPELLEMIANPVETCVSIRDGFKELVKLTGAEWKQIGKNLVHEFLSMGEQGVPFEGPTQQEVAAYLSGFTTGYLAEQALLTYVTAGVLRAGNIGVKLAQFVKQAKTGVVALAQVTKAAKAKNAAFRWLSQGVTDAASVRKLKKMVDDLDPPQCRGATP